MPNIQQEFVIECDAVGDDIGGMLLQEEWPIVFLSEGLSSKNLGLSTYEKEMLDVVFTIQKWRPYLIGKHFKDLHRPFQP